MRASGAQQARIQRRGKVKALSVLLPSVLTGSSHAEVVDAWLRALGPDPSVDRLLAALEAGFGALWKRARRTLGEITLSAVVERVLADVADHHPILQSLAVDTNGLLIRGLRSRTQAVTPAALADGVRFLLVSLLTLLGDLTGDILTPALHAELTAVVVGDAGSPT